MDMKTLRDKIESLDPGVHGALKQALTTEYKRLSGHGVESGSQKKCHAELFDELFKNAANDLGERYICGTSDYIREQHPGLYQKTEEADRRMNEVWKAGHQGDASIEGFRKVLGEWHALHLRQIEIYAMAQARSQNGSDSMCGAG